MKKLQLQRIPFFPNRPGIQNNNGFQFSFLKSAKEESIVSMAVLQNRSVDFIFIRRPSMECPVDVFQAVYDQPDFLF